MTHCPMNATEFIQKWRKVQLSERSIAQPIVITDPEDLLAA